MAKRPAEPPGPPAGKNVSGRAKNHEHPRRLVFSFFQPDKNAQHHQQHHRRVEEQAVLHVEQYVEDFRFVPINKMLVGVGVTHPTARHFAPIEHLRNEKRERRERQHADFWQVVQEKSRTLAQGLPRIHVVAQDKQANERIRRANQHNPTQRPAEQSGICPRRFFEKTRRLPRHESEEAERINVRDAHLPRGIVEEVGAEKNSHQSPEHDFFRMSPTQHILKKKETDEAKKYPANRHRSAVVDVEIIHPVVVFQLAIPLRHEEKRRLEQRYTASVFDDDFALRVAQRPHRSLRKFVHIADDDHARQVQVVAFRIRPNHAARVPFDAVEHYPKHQWEQNKKIVATKKLHV